MSAQKQIFSLLMALLLVCGVIYIFLSSESITFESIESKTIEGKAVFNQVSFESRGEVDIWKMRQSHGGRLLALNEWDELMIKVDKKKRPYQVSFHQLKNGKESEYQVSCYYCHSNGPRIIRPETNSESAPLTFNQKLQIGMWNLRMKSYGKVEIKKSSLLLNKNKRATPLMYLGKKDLEPLTLTTCSMCHHDSWWGRGKLTKQQTMAINHLVDRGEMPPWPFSLSENEKQQIQEYLNEFK